MLWKFPSCLCQPHLLDRASAQPAIPSSVPEKWWTWWMWKLSLLTFLTHCDRSCYHSFGCCGCWLLLVVVGCCCWCCCCCCCRNRVHGFDQSPVPFVSAQGMIFYASLHLRISLLREVLGLRNDTGRWHLGLLRRGSCLDWWASEQHPNLTLDQHWLAPPSLTRQAKSQVVPESFKHENHISITFPQQWINDLSYCQLKVYLDCQEGGSYGWHWGWNFGIQSWQLVRVLCFTRYWLLLPQPCHSLEVVSDN